jgi:hypothetical protein
MPLSATLIGLPDFRINFFKISFISSCDRFPHIFYFTGWASKKRALDNVEKKY